jgi:hypothetical protein
MEKSSADPPRTDWRTSAIELPERCKHDRLKATRSQKLEASSGERDTTKEPREDRILAAKEMP